MTCLVDLMNRVGQFLLLAESDNMECFNQGEWQMVGKMVNILQSIDHACRELCGDYIQPFP
jgi:hypothetical protein